MAEKTKIAWAHSTFNPWTGCSAVSPACDHCYARDQWAARTGRNFSERRRTTTSYWNQALKWNAEAKASGQRRRVFPSLCDPLDAEVPIGWFADFLRLIGATPNLTWLLLTKRPENFRTQMLSAAEFCYATEQGTLYATIVAWIAGEAPANIRMGITAENQECLEKRMGPFREIPSLGRFLSCEPLLGPVDLHNGDDMDDDEDSGVGCIICEVGGRRHQHMFTERCWRGMFDWVIAGGESGPKARPTHPDWARNLRDQCQAAGVPFMWKQWGEFSTVQPETTAGRVSYTNVFSGVAMDAPTPMFRVGKATAGHLLDGVEHMAVPEGW